MGTKSQVRQRWEESTATKETWVVYWEKTWVRLLVLYVFALIFLYLLRPPIVCCDNARDDLDAYRCSPLRLFAWAAVTPIAYLVLPILLDDV
jgi:hypothetical protein